MLEDNKRIRIFKNGKAGAVGKSNETVARLQSIYQYLPRIITASGVSKEEERIKTENGSYDISKDPQAKF